MAFKLAFLYIATVLCLAILLIDQMPWQTDAVAVHPAVRTAVRLANTKGGQMALGVVAPGALPAARMAKHFVN
ncbi:hypothetical protein niasHS_008006 [Heterodera schachtii]|uniref:Uncharacterized protein n=1 Tax=Heterodera schachtii TaxID=97005 RepID=A0ABD2JB09_HETSC